MRHVGVGAAGTTIFDDYMMTTLVMHAGVEAAGMGVDTDKHAATITKGTPGVLHGSFSLLLQDAEGQVIDPHSISAGYHPFPAPLSACLSVSAACLSVIVHLSGSHTCLSAHWPVCAILWLPVSLPVCLFVCQNTCFAYVCICPIVCGLVPFLQSAWVPALCPLWGLLMQLSLLVLIIYLIKIVGHMVRQFMAWGRSQDLTPVYFIHSSQPDSTCISCPVCVPMLVSQ